MHPTRLRFALLGLALTLAIGGAFTAMPTQAQTPSPPSPADQSPLETPSPTTAEPTTTAPSPTATATPTATPSPTASPTPTAAPSATATTVPTMAPSPTAPQTPGAGGILPGLPLPPQVVLLAGAGCGVALLLVLVLLVLFLRRRRPSKKPTAPLPPVKPSPPWLEARVSGKARPFPLQKDAVTIGRAPDNDLVIPQDLPGWETVSRHHARLYRQGDRWMVEDLQSTNGVYVNGKRTGRNLLQDGWRLDIGGVTFIFHAGTGGAA